MQIRTTFNRDRMDFIIGDKSREDVFNLLHMFINSRMFLEGVSGFFNHICDSYVCIKEADYTLSGTDDKKDYIIFFSFVLYDCFSIAGHKALTNKMTYIVFNSLVENLFYQFMYDINIKYYNKGEVE